MISHLLSKSTFVSRQNKFPAPMFSSKFRTSISFSECICIPRHESRPGARKGGCTLSPRPSPWPLSTRVYIHGCRARWCDVALVWGHARMGVLQAAAAWIRQCIGIKKRSRGTKRRDSNGVGNAMGGKRGQGGRGRTLDIIAAWWRAIRGSLAVGLALLTILTSLFVRKECRNFYWGALTRHDFARRDCRIKMILYCRWRGVKQQFRARNLNERLTQYRLSYG